MPCSRPPRASRDDSDELPLTGAAGHCHCGAIRTQSWVTGFGGQCEPQPNQWRGTPSAAELQLVEPVWPAVGIGTGQDCEGLVVVSARDLS
jgi:hypothetical protein